MNRYLLTLFIALLYVPAFGQQVVLHGNITDNQGHAVSFASVYVKGSTITTTANEDGVYRLKLKPGHYTINYRLVGFKQLTNEVDLTGNANHNVKLTYEDYQPVQASATGEDPAFEIIRNAIKNREHHLNEIDAYSCNVYIQGTQKLLSAPKGMLSNGVSRELKVDTGRNRIMYISEYQSKLNYGRPDKYKEVMISSQAAGNYNAFNYSRAANLQVNFYKNMIDIEGLNPRGFVSPIAYNALTFYTYKLIGTTTENGKLIDKIQVIPIRETAPVFKGNIYIVDGDWRVYNAHLYVTKQSNLNFVDTLNINQQYIPVKDGVWQPASVSLTYSGDVLGFRYYGYILGVYSDYDLNPKFPPHYFNGETMLQTNESVKRDSAYWKQNRPVPLTADAQRNYDHKDSILRKQSGIAYRDSAEKVGNHFNPVTYVFAGDSVKHWRTGETYTLNPLYDVVSYNTVEGWNIDLKPSYIKQYPSGKEFSVSPEVRYGFENHLLSVNSGFSYKFDPIKQGFVYANVGSNLFDINNAGSVGKFLNSFSTLFFKENYLKLYRSKYASAGVKEEVVTGLNLDVNLEYARRTALQNSSNRTVGSFPNKEFTSNNPLIPNLDAPLLFAENNALTLKVSAVYTFDEEYTTTANGRIYGQYKYPKIKFNYHKGINAFGSDVNYDYADVQVFHDHINLGVYGFSSFLITAGKFFNDKSVSFPDYKWFQGNQGITFAPGISEFHFLPYYTYAPTSFVEAHYEHNFSGFLFSQVPFLHRLKLEEIIGGNYLTQKLNPNYAEFYIGVQRFFFRFDYGFAYEGNGKFEHGIKIYFGI